MSKLELPADVADKVVAMLKPRFRPEAVLIFKENERVASAKILTNPANLSSKILINPATLSEDELSFLVSKKPIISSVVAQTPEFEGKRCGHEYVLKKEKGMLELDFGYYVNLDEPRMAATLLGFQYRSKEINGGMVTDVWYRDAHRESPEIA
jgi:hypothetical protein